jgi:hypothetical protein
MNAPDTLSLEGLDITVTETTDALTYTFTPQTSRPVRSKFPLTLVVLVIGFPLGLLALVAYALIVTNANRPGWELALTGLFAVQLIGLLVSFGAAVLKMSFRSWFRPSIVLVFTDTGVRHGGDRVCELVDVRGLRLLTYTEKIRYLADTALPRDVPPAPGLPPIPPELAPMAPGERPPEKIEAYLSLVIGAEGETHGLFGGFDVPALRALADDIHRRLAAFRANQGLLSALDPLAVIETTGEDAQKFSHTRSKPASGPLALARAIVENRWAGSAWCLAMFAGLYGSAQLVLSAKLPAALLLGHLVLGATHFALLLGALNTSGPGSPDEKNS